MLPAEGWQAVKETFIFSRMNKMFYDIFVHTGLQRIYPVTIEIETVQRTLQGW